MKLRVKKCSIRNYGIGWRGQNSAFLPGSHERDAKVAVQMAEYGGGSSGFLEMDDVDSAQALSSGVQGIVSKGTWRHGLFARKEFRFEAEINKEIDIAVNVVSHPNYIVHYFGCSLDER